jgi:hypothetical protein
LGQKRRKKGEEHHRTIEREGGGAKSITDYRIQIQRHAPLYT